jgi:kynurenine formamidase
VFTINQCLKEFHFFSKLVSIFPQKMDNGDRVITKAQLMEVLEKNSCKALIIRTMPNDNFKKTTNYSGVNPPYLHHEAVSYLVECGVEHLLVDLPSVDREEDEGKLLAHKAFWHYPENTRSNCTITELIYVPNEVKDGFYFLNIQIASFEMDASPSKIILFDFVD